MESIIADLWPGYRLLEEMNYQENPALLSEMEAVAAPSYEKTRSLLAREFAHNHSVCFIRNREQELVAFFLTNFDEIDNELFSYMGLLAIDPRFKNSSLAAPLVFHYIRRLKEKEFLLGRPIQPWATTATLTVLKLLGSFCHHEPKIDGSFTEAGEAIARKIGQLYKLPSDQSNPFIVRGLAHDTQYSKEENLRMELATRRKGSHVLEQFRIDERAGDRLIVVVRSLDVQKYLQWSQKLRLDPGYWLQANDGYRLQANESIPFVCPDDQYLLTSKTSLHQYAP
jgi:hypothetical protein